MQSAQDRVGHQSRDPTTISSTATAPAYFVWLGIRRSIGNGLAEIGVLDEPKRIYSRFVERYESMKVVIPARR